MKQISEELFDVGLRPENIDWPFSHQLPVFNWFYPFSNPADKLDLPISRLTRFQWDKVRRISIYLHIPFCDTICSFCPFTRGAYKNGDEIEHYVQALINEIELKRPLMGKLPVDSVFFGGGTPSVLSENQILRIGKTVSNNFNLDNIKEFAIESEVKSITKTKLEAFRQIGANRLSFGVQTFSHIHRDALNLDASIEQINKTAQWANKIFDYTNIDIIYGQAGQTLDNVVEDVQKAINLQTTTIDFYPMNNLAAQTKMHKNFKQIGYNIPSAIERITQRKVIVDLMLSKGYTRINGYSFALKGSEHTQLIQEYPKFLYHDILYGFSNDVILGYGSAAHSQLPQFNMYNTSNRKKFIKSINQYNILPFEIRKVDNITEKGIVTFPYRGKISFKDFETEQPSNRTKKIMQEYLNAQLISKSKTHFNLTEQGWLFYVNMMYHLMPEKGRKWISERMHYRIKTKHEYENTLLPKFI